MAKHTYRVRVPGLTPGMETRPITVDGDIQDCREIHLYNETGEMIGALDLYTDRIEVIQFDADGDPHQTLNIPITQPVPRATT